MTLTDSCLDENGNIAVTWRNFRVKGHVEKVLEEALSP